MSAKAAKLAFFLSALVLPFPARAQQPPQTVILTDTQAAQLLIENNRLDDAKKILLHDLETRPEDSETLFLLGTIAVAEKDYDAAISYFRHILVNEPNAERVRLELARAFFLKGDYDNADRQFRFARAGDVPDAVKVNIDRFLSAINRLKQWTFNFSLALAPDSNENAATGVSLIDIYGLPFTLDPGARRKSGLGLAGDVGGEWSPLIGSNLKARVGLDAYRLEYGGGQLDDMTISSYAGPQLLFSDWNISLLATSFQRWYGNRPYLNGGGGRLMADIGITSDWLVGVSLGEQSLFYRTNPAQNGPLFSLGGQLSYVLSPSSLFQVQAGFNRQDAAVQPYSYSAWWLGGAYSQDLPYGFSAGFQPSYYFTDYDRPLAGFGITRSDRALMLNFTLLNRRFDYHGFTPKFSYSFTNQDSNITLYRYTRSQFQLGVTSQF
ncbi:MAG TPA: surface lipoprotein assembly modifier [Rhizomicrobium sp.]|nr:surface lipoprotein assembly modifier [Rhizomicrobium sp.]